MNDLILFVIGSCIGSFIGVSLSNIVFKKREDS